MYHISHITYHISDPFPMDPVQAPLPWHDEFPTPSLFSLLWADLICFTRSAPVCVQMCAAAESKGESGLGTARILVRFPGGDRLRDAGQQQPERMFAACDVDSHRHVCLLLHAMPRIPQGSVDLRAESRSCFVVGARWGGVHDARRRRP